MKQCVMLYDGNVCQRVTSRAILLWEDSSFENRVEMIFITIFKLECM